MNLVIDDAVEVKQITKTNPEETRRQLGELLRKHNGIKSGGANTHTGQILLKGDNVSLIQSLSG